MLDLHLLGLYRNLEFCRVRVAAADVIEGYSGSQQGGQCAGDVDENISGESMGAVALRNRSSSSSSMLMVG